MGTESQKTPSPLVSQNEKKENGILILRINNSQNEKKQRIEKRI